ncbi:hypothetical protein [Pseudomonas sp.]|uniref:hypothetical protein n=1 Tax=Pseudomonas sp. TaxID=306 RepID=UPI003D097ABA
MRHGALEVASLIPNATRTPPVTRSSIFISEGRRNKRPKGTVAASSRVIQGAGKRKAPPRGQRRHRFTMPGQSPTTIDGDDARVRAVLARQNGAASSDANGFDPLLPNNDAALPRTIQAHLMPSEKAAATAAETASVCSIFSAFAHNQGAGYCARRPPFRGRQSRIEP